MRVAARGEMEVIHDLAYPLPVIVIAELLGIPAADPRRFKQWSDTLAVLLDPLQAVDGLGADRARLRRDHRLHAADLRRHAGGRRATI